MGFYRVLAGCKCKRIIVFVFNLAMKGVIFIGKKNFKIMNIFHA